MEPKKIKIPKVNPALSYKLEINKGDVVETLKGAFRVTFKKQTIAGVTIPQGYTIWLHAVNASLRESGSILICYLDGKRLNEILKTLYLDELRKG